MPHHRQRSNMVYQCSCLCFQKETYYFKEYFRSLKPADKGRLDMYGENRYSSAYYGQINQKTIYNNGNSSACIIYYLLINATWFHWNSPENEKNVPSSFNMSWCISGSSCSVSNYGDSPIDASGESFWGFIVPGAYIYGPSAVWKHAYKNIGEDVSKGKPVNCLLSLLISTLPVLGILFTIGRLSRHRGANDDWCLTTYRHHKGHEV